MNRLRKWMPLALCCVPGVAVAAALAIGVSAGGTTVGVSLGGPRGVVIVALAALACPLTMGLMLLRQRGSSRGANQAPETATATADCCLARQAGAASEPGAAERLLALRARREALERELAEM